MRLSSKFLIFTAAFLVLVCVMVLDSHLRQAAAGPERQVRAALVRDLRLTDLCLFTEARYTRHPSMADRHAPFQDHPLAMEHFPSGSLATPPLMAERLHEQHP